MPAYFDHNATTPLHPKVLAAMQPFLAGPYANPSSLHRFGRLARDAVETARAQVAALADVPPEWVIWTSGGTEADNLAIKGLALLPGGSPGRVLYGATEHPAVMEAAESLVAYGVPVETIAVTPAGTVDTRAFQLQLAAGPVRVASLMAANNETGVVMDPARFAAAIHAAGGWLHVDATQAGGKMACTMDGLGADLMTLSAHKIYGPKGAGALIVRPEVELLPLIHGGAQEKGRRGGTENLPAVVGFGAACALAMAETETRMAHALVLRERLEAGLAARGDTAIFGREGVRLANTCQFSVTGWDGEALLMALDRKGFAVSSGSACASGSGEPSHVLLAMGIDPVTAKGAVRASFGRANTEAEVTAFLAALTKIAPPSMTLTARAA